MKLLDPGERLRHEDFQELLQKFLPSLPSSVLSLLEEIHELRIYQPGDTLMEEGESADGVIVLSRGAAVASLLVKSGDRIKLCEIIAPAVLGLSETMLAETSRTTIRCELPITAVFLPAPSFIDALRRSPLASLEFSKLIGQELNATYCRLAEMRRPISAALR